MSLSPREYLHHILDEADYLLAASQGLSQPDFVQDETLKRAFVRSIEIIGEAVTKLNPGLQAHHSDVPWREIAAMRNRLILGYMNVDSQIVWDTVVQVLPDFLTKTRVILSELND